MHAVNQTRKEFGLVLREVAVLPSQAFQSNRKLHVARTDHVLNLKVFELRGKSELDDDLGVFSRRLARQRLRLRARAHHLARAENQRRRLRITNPHDRRRESLRAFKPPSFVVSHRRTHRARFARLSPRRLRVAAPLDYTRRFSRETRSSSDPAYSPGSPSPRYSYARASRRQSIALATLASPSSAPIPARAECVAPIEFRAE